MKRFSLDAMRKIKEGEREEMKKLSSTFRRNRPLYRMEDALPDSINIIAELKHRSPSHGMIEGHIPDSARLARYVYGGAAAISILTEREFFGGSYEMMKLASEELRVPLLCKDFIFFSEQIDAAYACGADAVLLIARALEKKELEELYSAANERGLLPLIEICHKEEIDKIAEIDPNIVMVNMRDLETLEINFARGVETLGALPGGVTAISASGINSGSDIQFIMKETGVKNFLVGAALMRQREPDIFIRELRDVR